MRSRLAVLVTLLLTAPALSQQPTGEFREILEVVEVEVPVHVVDKSGPVRGLEAENFQLFDGRKRVELSGFSVYDLGEPETAASAVRLPAAARRHFLFLFDLTYTEADGFARARSAARRMVDESLHPSDLVGVASYSIRTGAEIVLGFTSDRLQVHLAIESLGLVQLLAPDRDPLGLMLAASGFTDGADPQGGLDAPQAGGSRRDAMLALINSFRQEYREDLLIFQEHDRRNNRRVAQKNAMAFSDSMEILAEMLQAADGRKHVILLSRGFDASVLLGTEDPAAQQRMNRASELGETWKIDSDQRFGNTSTLSVVDQMIAELRRADVVVQAVDVGGLNAESSVRSKAEDSLFLMANGTGGELLRNFNDPGEAMAQVLDRTSVTYLLRFQPKALKHDGSFRRLRVKLKGGPKGARLVHRPGYYEPEPFARRTALEKRFDAASAILAEPAGGAFDSAILATPFRSSGDRAYVPVLVEIDGKSLLAGHRGSRIDLEIYGYAFDGEGGVRDYFSHAMGLDLNVVGTTLANRGLKFYGHLDLDPGSHSLRVLVRETQSGRTSLRTLPITVPSYGRSASGLSMPLFPEPVEAWLMVRENPEDRGGQSAAYPFMADGEAFVPAARPTLSQSQPASFYLVAYNVDASAALEARILHHDGTAQAAGGVEVGEWIVDPSGRSTLPVRFDVQGLEAGSYRLALELGKAAGEGLQTEIPFVVASDG